MWHFKWASDNINEIVNLVKHEALAFFVAITSNSFAEQFNTYR